MYNAPHVYARDGDSAHSGSKLSTSTIVIIVVVCGSVVVLASVLFLWRLVFRLCRRQKPNPLPPVQLLAHQRQEQVASFAERKTFYESDSFRGSLHKPVLQHTSSYASLIPGSGASTRQNSLNVDEAISAESISVLGLPVSTDNLTPPNPSFNPLVRTASIASSSADSSENVPHSSSIPFSDASSSMSHVTSLGGHALSSRPGGRSMARSQSRPASLASSAGTTHSVQSRRSVLRGAPHSRLSNIQIVLPAPLAPEVYPYPTGADGTSSTRNSYMMSSYQGSESSRRSVFVDQWAPGGARSVSMNSTNSGGRMYTSPSPVRAGSTNPRIPSSLSQSTTASSIPRMDRRSQSQPRMIGPHPDSQAYPPYMNPSIPHSPPPPVPRLPPDFSNPHQAVATYEEPERGRPRSSTMSRTSQKPLPQISAQSSDGSQDSLAALPAPLTAILDALGQSLPPQWSEVQRHPPRSSSRGTTPRKTREDDSS